MNRIDITPWLKEVVFLDGEEWRKSDRYKLLYVSRKGEVRRFSKTYGLLSVEVTKIKTSVGFYLGINCQRLSDDRRTVAGIHQLVARAFLGPPPDDGLEYEPNHKDGNKHNNCVENLEWVTRSENVLHAYRTGLSKNGVRMKAENILTGKIIKTNTLSEMARIFKITRPSLKNILCSTGSRAWNNEWIFTFDGASDDSVKRHQRSAVCFKNYETGEITICSDGDRAAMLSGVRATTLRLRLRNQRKDPSKKQELLSSFVFRDLSDTSPWPDYSKEEVEKSKIRYRDGSFGRKEPTLPADAAVP